MLPAMRDLSCDQLVRVLTSLADLGWQPSRTFQDAYVVGGVRCGNLLVLNELLAGLLRYSFFVRAFLHENGHHVCVVVQVSDKSCNPEICGVCVWGGGSAKRTEIPDGFVGLFFGNEVNHLSLIKVENSLFSRRAS